MRVCPSCYSLFGPEQGMCPKDGTETEDSIQVLIGRFLGPYSIKSVIGEGGMGVVYVGEHTTIGRRVALKVLRPELSLRDDIVERFIQEARSVNTIGHSNIVNIYDFGRTPFGSFYIVMEYLDGQTIRELIDDEGPQPIQRVRKVVMEVGAALAAAHSKGFIHRDVKPENVIVSERKGSTHVKLVDFGIAKLLQPGHSPITKTGAAMGTPQYMCPEQLEDAPFDHRVDIYSLGVVTYEMITGILPYPGKSHAEVRQMQLTRTPVPPSATRGEGAISRKLDAVILWALSPQAETRCPRIEDFLSTFQAGYDEIGKCEEPPSKPKHGKALRLFFGVLLGFVAFAVGASLIVLLKSNKSTSGRVVTVKPDVAAIRRDNAPSAPKLSEAEAVKMAEKKVLHGLVSQKATERERVASFLSHRRIPLFRKQLEKALKDSHPNVRRAAARALGKMGHKESIPALRQALKENVGYVCWDAAGALARLKDQIGLLRLRVDLLKLTSPRDIFKRKYILHILGKLGDPSAVGWKNIIDGQQGMVNASLKRQVWGYLATQGDKKARQQLIKTISNDEWPARIEAAVALEPTDKRLAQKTLRRALNHTRGRYRLKAAQQLAYFGDEKAANALVEFLQSSDPKTRQESALALGNLPGATTRKELWNVLFDPSPMVAMAGAVALLRPRAGM